jgi:ethanolamine utilization microcompartment shell protein EutS
MDTTVTETLRHSLTVSDSDFQLTLVSGPTGAASTVAGPAGPAGAAGAAGPNSITSATASDSTANITVSTLGVNSTLTAEVGVINTDLTMNGDQKFVDGIKANFGTDNDFQIYHDNTNSRILNGTGELWITSQVPDSETDKGGIVFWADSGSGGASHEYIKINGNDVVTEFKKNIRFSDDIKIQLGASQDLEIYHDASNSYIDDKGTGNLNIRGTNLNLQSYTGETFVACVADGAVSLYHDNASKLSTSATGIAVTGGVSATGTISITTGNITITSGDVAITSGNISTQSGNITTLSGDITTSVGNVIVGTGNVSVTNGDVTAPDILASEELGYSSGGTVTQGTSITTGVTLNEPCGVINCFAHSFANDDSRTFVLTNNKIDANDVIVVNFQTGHEELYAEVSDVSAGSCSITLHGTHSGSSITPDPFSAVLNFAVIKVATS